MNHTSVPPGKTRAVCGTLSLFGALSFSACSETGTLVVHVPLHLEEHLGRASFVGSALPENIPEPVEWHFDEPQPDWRRVEPRTPGWEVVRPVRVDDALRIPLTARNRPPNAHSLVGVIYVPVPDWDLDDWGYLEIRARTDDPVGYLWVLFNYTEDDAVPNLNVPFQSRGARAPVITDGSVQTYRLPLHMDGMRMLEGPWTHLAIAINGRREAESASIDLLSVRVLPKEAEYADTGFGAREIVVGNQYRRAFFTHTPNRLEYRVQVPDGGRLDTGFGVLRDDVPVTFRVQVRAAGGEPNVLLEEQYGDATHWAQRSVDLVGHAGRTVTLALETEADVAGTVAFWGAPTVSGSSRPADKPNVIFYIIDGAGAEYMSLYGYNRRTTPNIDRLAAEGAVLEQAYSNSSWTLPSTASFMTSLQHSVLGGERNGFNVVPEDVLTMAQHFHRAGYQTGVFTANPNAGRLSGLEREVDSFRESWEEFSYDAGTGKYEESSKTLHNAFWNWREDYPGEPYWVHFQTVDIHGNFPAPEPFSGLFVGPDQLETMEVWRERLGVERIRGIYSDNWERTGISRVAFWAVRQSLYDETMAHNDYQLGRLVKRLKATGEWENTLLIVAADHGIRAAIGDIGVAIQDALPPRWYVRDEPPNSSPLLRPSVSRIPLLFVWPGHIPGGLRIKEPAVSMLDVLPTVLDLAGLPMPDVLQGQSLAPLLLGQGRWEGRPVVFDEFYADAESEELHGFLEVIDGRWGASLEINPYPDLPAEQQRPVPLLLFDLWNDPRCLRSIHEERLDLVEQYTAFLERQWAAHRALAQLFTPSEAAPLTPEQLETLRALGYIR